MTIIQELEENIKYLNTITGELKTTLKLYTESAVMSVQATDVELIKNQIKSLTYSIELLTNKLNTCNNIRNDILQMIDSGKEDPFSIYENSNNLYFQYNNKHRYIEIGNLEEGMCCSERENKEYYPIDKIDVAIEAFLGRYFNDDKSLPSSTGKQYSIKGSYSHSKIYPAEIQTLIDETSVRTSNNTVEAMLEFADKLHKKK